MNEQHHHSPLQVSSLWVLSARRTNIKHHEKQKTRIIRNNKPQQFPIVFLILLLFPNMAHASSGCGLCASTGDCHQAFQGQPGQYCGTFYSQLQNTAKPCCCPSFEDTGAVCKLSPTSCMCHVTDTTKTNTNNGAGGGGSAGGSSGHYTAPNNNNHNNHQHHNGPSLSTPAPIISSNAVTGLLSALFWLLLLGGCISCCCGCCCRPQHLEEEEKPFYVPSTSTPATNPSYYSTKHSYGATAPYATTDDTMVAIPPPTTTANNPNHNNNSWWSGLGGLAVGAALGSGVQRQVDRTMAAGAGTAEAYDDRTGYRHHGDSSGYDIPGDTGDNGYDIAGDTGDDNNGYDIPGDF